MTRPASDDTLGLPASVLALARAHTTGEVATTTHAISRARVLDAVARPKPAAPAWAVVAGATIACGAVLWALRLPRGEAITRDVAPVDSATSRTLLTDDVAPASGSFPADHDVIDSLRPSFRMCYEAFPPPTSGRVVIEAVIAPDGSVRSAVVSSNDGLSAEVATCLTSAVSDARFAPDRAERKLRVPVTFTVTP